MALIYSEHRDPFPHYIFDEFIDPGLADALIQEFPGYDDPRWFRYDNPLEHKRAIRDWSAFPAKTYGFFHWLCSPGFVSQLCEITGCRDIQPDIGLHGAGWHMQSRGDHLNVHLDYNLHPFLGLKRKFNLIVYLSDWRADWGGNLEFWSDDNGRPGQCRARVTPGLGRAVLFDTSCQSWHGYFDPIVCPEGVYRRSIAMYYLTTPDSDPDPRNRALYAPSPDQDHDPEVLALIRSRAHR